MALQTIPGIIINLILENLVMDLLKASEQKRFIFHYLSRFIVALFACLVIVVFVGRMKVVRGLDHDMVFSMSLVLIKKIQVVSSIYISNMDVVELDMILLCICLTVSRRIIKNIIISFTFNRRSQSLTIKYLLTFKLLAIFVSLLKKIAND